MEKSIKKHDESPLVSMVNPQEKNEQTDRLFVHSPGKEDVSRREEFVKHFNLGGKRRQAVVYPSAVHYRESDQDEWKEIDNTLEEVVTTHGRKILRNKSNRIHMEFPQELDDESMASISCEGNTFSWQFEQKVQKAKARRRNGEELRKERLVKKARGMAKYAGRTEESLHSADLVAEMYSEQEQRMEVTQLRAENCYDEVLPGISLRYELVGDSLKEDIILSNRDALSRAAIRLPDIFDYEVSAQQELRILDKVNGELLFIMNTPLVYDADGKKVEGSIRLTPCAKYTRMEYMIDKEFLDAAVWPVTIDPMTKYAKSRTSIMDAGLYRTEAPDTPHYNKEDYNCGNRGAYEYITLVKFNALVRQRASDTIVAAYVGMHPTSSHNAAEYMACYPMNKDWNAYTATWNNMYPDTTEYISDEVISYVDATGSTCFFNITNLYRSWYEKGKNHGVAFRYPLGVNGEYHYVSWAGAVRNSENGPCMIVNYLSHAGLESWWKYESLSAGGVGTAHVDLFNGNLVFEHADLAMSGNRLPVSVTHYYNSCLALTNEQGCGKGWRMSVMQSMHLIALTNVNWSLTYYYVWTDGDGTEHYFPFVGSAPFKDEETQTLELTFYGGEAIITSKDDTKMFFPQPTDMNKKYITKLLDACENKVEYFYHATTGLLERIEDPAGRKTEFEYNNNMLAKITRQNQPSICFAYDADSQLIAIVHESLGTLNLSYSNGLLTGAADTDGQLGGVGLQIGYQDLNSFEDNAESDIESCRVTSMMQTGIPDRGSMLSFEYMTSMTKVKVLKSGDTENPVGKTLSYQFNDNGNLVCVFDELGYAQRADFDNYNAQQNSSRMQKAVINLAKDLVFANTSADWIHEKECQEDTIAQDIVTRCLGMPSLKIEKMGEGETIIKQVAQVYKSGKHTFSAYIKAVDLDGGAFLRVIYGNKKASSIAVQGSTENANCGQGAEGWERVYVTVDAPAGEIALELVCTGASGTAHFACPQLETGESANRVNLLTNGDFSRTEVNTENYLQARSFPADWTRFDGITTDVLNGVVTADHDMPDFLSGNALRMVSYPALLSVGFQQTIPVSGAQGDVFVLGGWLNSRSVSSGNVYSIPSLVYRFTGGTSDGVWRYVNFSREWVGWQFGAWAISAPGSYTSLSIAVFYACNAQTAMFTNIFLYREQFGQSFAYDANKNLISLENLAGQKSAMQYDYYDNLISYVQPGADATDKYLLTYGADANDMMKHLLKTSTTPEGVKQVFEHDRFGNCTYSKTVSSDSKVIGVQTVYDGDGNYAIESIDARGKAVTRSINEDDYTLTSVTDPDGQTVSYEYDAAKRVIGVQTVADGATYKNAYTYENNRIKTVAHNTNGDACDVVYRFEYDGLGRKTCVKVGNADSQNQLLSNNVYSNDRSGLLEEVQYGNGGKVRYAYDDFDRLTSISYDEETEPRYSYIYDATGEVAKVIDHHLNRSIETERDLASRPRQSSLKDAEGNLLYRTTLYYDKMNRLEKFAENIDGEAHTSAYAYDKDNRTTQIAYDGETNKVAYTYDALGRIASRIATVGDNNYETAYTFVGGDVARYGTGATTALVEQITQGTGANAMNFQYTYDNRGNIISETRNGATTNYTYDALGQLIRVDDPHERATWKYEYDRGGNIKKKEQYVWPADAVSAPDPLGNPTKTINYGYGDPNWKDKLTSYDGKTITYDAIGNPLNDGVRTYTWGAGRQLRHISMPSGAAHGLQIRDGVHEESNTVLRIVRDGYKLKARLLRDGRDMTDERPANAFAWKKNDAALVNAREITITDAEINGVANFTCTYTETQGAYGSVNVDENLVASHTPASTDANHVFSLSNGELKVTIPDGAGSGEDYSLDDGSLYVNPGFSGSVTAAYEFTNEPTLEIDFEYNHNGLRTQKRVVENGITTIYDYTLHGKLITHLTKRVVDLEGVETDNEEMHFFYDAQGRPAFVEYEGTMYRYIHNLQGDIVAIVDADGNPVVEYKYDAWGVSKRISSQLDETLGVVNPFRYRGYIYDEDTSFYYLRTRFYCPEWKRFVNEDALVGIGGCLLSYNMFAYCSGNPIMLIDSSGRKARGLLSDILQAVGEMAEEIVGNLISAGQKAFKKFKSVAEKYKSASKGKDLMTDIAQMIPFDKEMKITEFCITTRALPNSVLHTALSTVADYLGFPGVSSQIANAFNSIPMLSGWSSFADFATNWIAVRCGAWAGEFSSGTHMQYNIEMNITYPDNSSLYLCFSFEEEEYFKGLNVFSAFGNGFGIGFVTNTTI